MSIDAMKQALEALEHIHRTGDTQVFDLCYANTVIPALRAAIEQAQEPVAWMHNLIEGNAITHRPADIDRHPERWTALYTAPPPCPTCEALARTVMMDQTSHDMAPRQWQGLTDEDRDEILRWVEWKEIGSQPVAPQKLIAYVEKKLREKNGA